MKTGTFYYMTKVEKHRMWKRLRSYIPEPRFRTAKEKKKYDRYSYYIQQSKPTEQDWADHTFMLLQKED